jgi:alpha-glucosidase
MIGEVVLPPARAVAYYGDDLDEAHFPHNFALTEIREWSAAEVRAVVEGYEAVLPPGAWPNWLLGDHDFSRIASRVGPERSRLVQMLLLSRRDRVASQLLRNGARAARDLEHRARRRPAADVREPG